MYTNAYFMNHYFYNTVERPMLKRQKAEFKEQIAEAESKVKVDEAKVKELKEMLADIEAKL